MNQKQKIKTKLLISGRVQAVGYRFWCRHTAAKLGIACEAKNLNDGRVEVILEGQKEKVEKMIELCHSGPPLAKVDEIKIDYSPDLS